MQNKCKKTLLMANLFFIFLFLLNSVTTTTNNSNNSSFALIKNKTNNQTEVTSDHIYVTLRKDNFIFDLQKNITIPTGKDMVYVDVTSDGKIVAANSNMDD